MSEPVWVSGAKRRARQERRWDRAEQRRWRMEYDLAYDGGDGGTEWDGYYRTKIGALIAAWFHLHLRSWGGSARLFDQRVEENVVYVDIAPDLTGFESAIRSLSTATTKEESND